MNTKTRTQIIRYLKDRGICESFKQNIVKFRGYPAGSETRYTTAYIRQMLTRGTGHDIIVSAFRWIGTPEGKDFWNAENEAFLRWFNA